MAVFDFKCIVSTAAQVKACVSSPGKGNWILEQMSKTSNCAMLIRDSPTLLEIKTPPQGSGRELAHLGMKIVGGEDADEAFLSSPNYRPVIASLPSPNYRPVIASLPSPNYRPVIASLPSPNYRTIILPSTFLTAAHCIKHPLLIDGVAKVKAGEYNLECSSGDEVARTVCGHKVYPEFEIRKSIHDIALLFLDEPLPFGYGKVTVTVNFISDDNCQRRYFLELILESHICAGSLGKDACQVCMGNNSRMMEKTVIAEDPCYWLMTPPRSTVVGITSYGYGCANPNYPGIYTEVWYYMDWISKHMRY
ncbi:unnamed protein product [Cyprideis torosa]|uniref:Uncharacterized protein n=1 Tax=Cyprideis torosa TaxID=163714 RepID=A0A7R8WD36_9CRUS|nr:unnamed protein product [Cyprideis torosa]CAG0894228.1 unnamed protein product [Cyprideis torosa]